MVRLSKGWERTFYFFTYVFQGAPSLSRAERPMRICPARTTPTATPKNPHSLLRFGHVFQSHHHRHGQSPNVVQRSFSYLVLRTRARFGTAMGQLADEEAQESPQVPSPVAEPTVAF
jgi:hypothetical protein